MFGMEDPSKVVVQFRRYAAEGRLELAEVMARELSERLLMTPAKERDLNQQRYLVDALRDLAAIYELREKYDESVTTGKQRDSARDQLIKQYKAEDRAPDAATEAEHRPTDTVQTGRAQAGRKKLGPALKLFAKARKLQANHIEASMRPLTALKQCTGSLAKGDKHAAALAAAIKAAGPLERHGEVYVVPPKGQTPMPLHLLEEEYADWTSSGLGSGAGASALKEVIEDLRVQRQRIEAGEQAASAELASAVNALQPKHDYHDYSRGGSR